MPAFGADTLRDLRQALRLEWLETDGLGGFASGTIVGANSRRYHGLLVAATRPPVGRRLLVSKLEESLEENEHRCELGCNIYQDAVYPQGHTLQTEFRLDPWPVFTWRCGSCLLTKAVFMPHRRGCTVVRYDVREAKHPVWLRVRPLLAGRDMHYLQSANVDFKGHLQQGDHSLTIQPYDDASRMVVSFPGGSFRPDGVWFYNFRYLHEQERGLDYLEDLYSPGEISWLLREGQTAWLVAGREDLREFDGPAWMAAEGQRRQAQTAGISEVKGRLILAANQFLVDRTVADRPAKSVIAGYPWFGDWGRDTMIALPGLTLATGRHEDCREMLRAFTGVMSHGLIPNHFDEATGQPGYNTVDATLWMFVAARRYYQATSDLESIKAIWPALQKSLQAHINGTLFDIRMTEDGLLTAGNQTTQLTWMDAKVGDWVVTPRHGKAVEINALWYNALKIGEFFARKLGREKQAGEHARLARRTKAAFEAFWCEELGYCYDCLGPAGPDATLRPNQVIACALPYSLLSPDRRRSILQVVGEHLLTPYGLRTLAPGSPGYTAHYGGDQVARDGAYHQGTVWPWLMGPYLTAYFKLMGVNQTSRRHARRLLQPLMDHLDQAGLGSVSEIFDAEEPYSPHGCPAQAWSVAELLRCFTEYKLDEV